MIRFHVNRALLVSAAMLVATAAFADPPTDKGNGAAHAQGNANAASAAKDAKKHEAKPADAKGKSAAAVDEGKDEKKLGDAKGDLASRKAKQHAEQKEHLAKILKQAPDEAIRQELRRHAERVAKIERIQSLAKDAKDTDAVNRSAKLLEKENARHDKWMSMHASGPAAAPGAPATAAATTDTTGTKPETKPAAPAAPAAKDTKGGAK
jgi:hypothetical protein